MIKNKWSIVRLAGQKKGWNLYCYFFKVRLYSDKTFWSFLNVIAYTWYELCEKKIISFDKKLNFWDINIHMLLYLKIKC